jgi:hypothetical protein
MVEKLPKKSQTRVSSKVARGRVSGRGNYACLHMSGVAARQGCEGRGRMAQGDER